MVNALICMLQVPVGCRDVMRLGVFGWFDAAPINAKEQRL
jgi:hypothetical protein